MRILGFRLNIPAVLASLTVVAGVFGGCQSVATNSEERKPYELSFTLDSVKQPTSVEWRTVDGAKGTTQLEIKGTKGTVRFETAKPLQDTLFLEFWRAGVLYKTGAWSKDLKYLSQKPHQVADLLMTELGAVMHPDSFLVAYAKALVHRDTLFRDAPYPASAPKGLDTARVSRLVALEIVTQARPFAEAVAKAVMAGMDSASIRIQIRILFVSGTIKDTSEVFPPPRDLTPPVISILEPVNGKQLPSDQEVVLVKVRATDASGVDSVWIDHRLATKQDTLWVLDDVSVPATGKERQIEVLAKDSKGNTATATVAVVRQVAISDTIAPQVRVIEPSPGRVLAYSQPRVVVRIAATDASGIDSVWIGGSVAAKNGSDWESELTVPPTGLDYTIAIRVRDGKSNLTDTVVVVRRETKPADSTSLDTIPPRIVLAVQGEVKLTYDSAAYTLSCMVTDNIKVSMVTLAGVLVDGDKGLYSRRIELAEGRNVLRIAAIDSAGNSASDSVIVLRAAKPIVDTTRPVLVRKSVVPAMVPYDSVRMDFVWQVTDDRKLGAVRIGGEIVEGVDGIHSLRVALKVGSNMVVVVATDSAGNKSTDSIVVERDKDRVGPAIAAIGCEAVCNAPFDTTGFDVSWHVVDANLSDVWVDEAKIEGDSGIYRKRVALTGDTTLVVIKAIDSAGNETHDSLRIAKSADTQRPTLSRQAGTEDRSVPYATASVVVGWAVTDNGALKSVQISGFDFATGIDPIFKTTVPLVVGSNTIWIKALDESGNLATDSVIVTRGYHDSIAPVIVANDTLTRNRTVSFYTKTFTVSWKVTDNDALASVKIGDSIVAGAAGVYRATVNLALGANKIVVIATDTAKNVKRDSVTITQSKPDTLIASWDFTTPSTTVKDLTGHGFDLTQEATGIWKRANTKEFTPSFSGKTLIKARVWLDRYPSSANFNGVASVAGYNEGLRLVVSEFGQVVAVGQRGSASSWNWFGLRTKAGAVPLGRWVELAVGADNSTGTMGIWIDGVAQSTFANVAVAGSQIRSATSNPFYVGKDYVDGQKFAGKLQSVKVYSDYVLGAAKSWMVDSCITMHCRLADKPVASWTMPSDTVSTLSSAYNGLTLSKTAKGVWRRPGADTLLLPRLPTGQVLYRATVMIDSYPSASTYNKVQVVMGFYEGMKMGITNRGQVMVAGQRVLDGSANTWYGVRTADKAVPLKKQVTIDVGADQASGEFFIWIDGVKQRTWTPTTAAGQKIRVAGTRFTIGNDGSDPQKFIGKIYSASVYGRFVNGYGYHPEIDATIDD